MKRRSCSICDSCFTQKYNLNRHNFLVHESKKPQDCGSQKPKLDGQFELVHEGKKPQECSFCGTTFTSENCLNTHMASVHEGWSISQVEIFLKESLFSNYL